MILYHQSNNQIVFAISQNIAGKISNWFAHAESFHEFFNNIKFTIQREQGMGNRQQGNPPLFMWD
jgi:hypothetical protein